MTRRVAIVATVLVMRVGAAASLLDADTAVLRVRLVGRTIRLDVAECP